MSRLCEIPHEPFGCHGKSIVIMPQSLSTEELDWLAFQYAAGELRGIELDTFERLLATDDRVCEALARSVLLSQTIAHCERSSSPVTATASKTVPMLSRNETTRSSWHSVAAAAVACSLLLVTWKVWQGNPQPAAGPATSEVAALWLQGADDEIAREIPVAEQVSEAEEDDAVPAWMLAAVNEQQRSHNGEQILND